MIERDRLRAQYFRDWTEAILEDVYRQLWAPRWRRGMKVWA